MARDARVSSAPAATGGHGHGEPCAPWCGPGLARVFVSDGLATVLPAHVVCVYRQARASGSCDAIGRRLGSRQADHLPGHRGVVSLRGHGRVVNRTARSCCLLFSCGSREGEGPRGVGPDAVRRVLVCGRPAKAVARVSRVVGSMCVLHLGSEAGCPPVHDLIQNPSSETVKNSTPTFRGRATGSLPDLAPYMGTSAPGESGCDTSRAGAHPLGG